MTQITAFGKNIKKRLIDTDQTQTWLIDEVKKKTGLYFDSSYLYKVMSGRVATPSIISAICEILNIKYEPQSLNQPKRGERTPETIIDSINKTLELTKQTTT